MPCYISSPISFLKTCVATVGCWEGQELSLPFQALLRQHHAGILAGPQSSPVAVLPATRLEGWGPEAFWNLPTVTGLAVIGQALTPQPNCTPGVSPRWGLASHRPPAPGLQLRAVQGLLGCKQGVLWATARA